jgi:aspartate 1-decarboxylase
LGKAGDLLTIMSFTWMAAQEAEKWQPRVLVLGTGNKIINRRGM